MHLALSEEMQSKAKAIKQLEMTHVENQLLRDAANTARWDVKRIESELSERAKELLQQNEGYEVSTLKNEALDL